MKKTIYVLGIGHNSMDCIELAIECGYEVVGLYHYDSLRTNEVVHGFTILGSFDDLFNSDLVEGNNFLLSMGNNQIRATLFQRIIGLGGFVPTIIHPHATVSKFAKVSQLGVLVYPYAYIKADSEVGDNTIVLSHVSIAHTTKIGCHCLISVGAIVGAYVSVEDFVVFGMGALSISKKVGIIGHHALIGVRSLITHDVPPYAIMAGSPARQIGEVTLQRT